MSLLLHALSDMLQNPQLLSHIDLDMDGDGLDEIYNVIELVLLGFDP